MDFLIALYITCLALAELAGAKTFPLINLFGYQLNASVAIFLIPLIFSVNDIITEVHGKERTRSIIRSGLLMIFFIMMFSLFATLLEPSPRFSEAESAYDTIFFKSARISAASLVAFAAAEFMDVYVFSKVRERFGKKRLWLRNNLSNFVSQFLDTVIFMTLAFYAFDLSAGENAAFLLSLIIPYWLLKCFMSVIETPFVYLGVRWLKQGS
ncbi:MAG: hypothetical protein TR69_WS6001001019 [candidate division WS6 bacterium OLB20]|uniref:Probable queuosine precursor transporter n=1 Tax=candidate division WS6 bacterium OLB20 TaxID=1617426 RepID=A0A136LZC1_9BACT|nr:MAG: hypothetical protein TR69_WS6001001019 [candidate division WS6 bacterium OLB20]